MRADLPCSLVLRYSLSRTRQHHLDHLLPLIFSHPIIPAHNKPRARGPPKSTFLFPTPPPLTQPLPFKEYHGPQEPIEPSSSGGNGLPAGKSRKSQKTGEVEPPAHEIECIARVTLTVGPIEYPGTELWIGRFVEPRAPPPRKEKRDPVKRQALAESSAERRASSGATSQQSIRPQSTSTTHISTTPRGSTIYQPPPIRPTATPRVPFGPSPPPRQPAPTPAGPPRSNLVSPPHAIRSFGIRLTTSFSHHLSSSVSTSPRPNILGCPSSSTKLLEVARVKRNWRNLEE